LSLLLFRRQQQWWKLPKYWWKKAQRRLCWFVQLKYFNNFFLALILVNTILLAIEYDGMPDTLSEFLSTTNMVLTQLFTLEVVLKVRAAHHLPVVYFARAIFTRRLIAERPMCSVPVIGANSFLCSTVLHLCFKPAH
jgi:hypothetical protein